MKYDYYTFIFLPIPSEGWSRKAWKTSNKAIIFNPTYVQLEILLAYDTALLSSKVNMDRTMINRQRGLAKVPNLTQNGT